MMLHFSHKIPFVSWLALDLILFATGENENLKGPPKIASAVIFLVVDFRHFAKYSFCEKNIL